MKTKVTVLVLVLICFVASAWAQGSAEKGKALVQSKNCALCHKEGSKTGKPMEQLASGGPARIKGALTDPKTTLGPQVKMPAFKLPDDQLNDIAAYLQSIAK